MLGLAATSGQEDQPKPGRPRRTKTQKEAAEEVGQLAGEEDEEVEVEYEYDEESLPAEVQELLRRPSRGLAELLEEAGIEFGDPTLMDDVVEGRCPEGFRAGREDGCGCCSYVCVCSTACLLSRACELCV